MKILQIVLVSILFLQTSFAKEIEVCKTCKYTTIVDAIEVSDSGDVVLIQKGIYKEGNIIVDKSITIKGLDFPILDGENKTEILTITADGVTIEGLQIQNVGTSYIEDRAGLRIRKSKKFTIRNNILLNTFFGISLEHASDGVVENNKVIGKAELEMSSGNAIHLWYCKQIQIRKNLVQHHRDGIYLEFVDNSVVEGNVSEDNLRYGLHFMFSNNDDYLNNEFRRNGAGVAVMFSKKNKHEK
jgi:nitrous oxidase accessory protein